jgi:tRNA-2-methylthio-N6-dimethylallyladenosine synthase
MAGNYFLEIYGCQMNLADGELIRALLQGAGWKPVADAGHADLIVINTCAVRERAVERVIGRVRSLRPWKRGAPRRRIALVGCLARYRGRSLAAKLPEVDFFLGPDAYRRLPELVAGATSLPVFALAGERAETYGDLPVHRQPGVNAWISVMRGCDRRCAYCMVPFARGRERSLPVAHVLAAARAALAQGYPSLTLLGQTVTSYRDGACDFAALLAEVAALPGLLRLRFLAAHPVDFDARLLAGIAAQPVIARHLHLPLQAGSDRVLESMRRGYTRAGYLEVVDQARELIPGLAITTDLMAGFPGEQEEDFAQTLSLMERVEFDQAFMFAYSTRPHTYAARRLADEVAPEVKQERLRRMIALQEEHARRCYARRIGTTVEVLVEGPARNPAGHWYGRTSDFKDVIFSAAGPCEPRAGALAAVAVSGATSHTLFGRMSEPGDGAPPAS